MTSLLADLLESFTLPRNDDPVVCAVSGGPDSLALLVLTCAINQSVTAVYVDHGLRSDSAGDGEVVSAAAERFGAHFEYRKVEVKPGSNLEARARAARYGALGRNVLTGHTADDLAETVLINMLRGAGLDGQAPLRTETRPMLAIRRSQTQSLCVAMGLKAIDDPMNHDPAIVRNRVRHELIPLMNGIAQRDVVNVIARQSRGFGDIVEFLDALSGHINPVDALALTAAPPPLAARAVRQWIRRDTDAEFHPPDSAAVERILSVARGDSKSCDVTGGLRVVRSKQRMRLVRPVTSSHNKEL